jgi:hypothetical protein
LRQLFVDWVSAKKTEAEVEAEVEVEVKRWLRDWEAHALTHQLATDLSEEEPFQHRLHQYLDLGEAAHLQDSILLPVFFQMPKLQ